MRELRSLPIMLCLFFALAISGCATPGTGHSAGTQITTHNPEASEPRSEVPAPIKIASWNIRDFGNAKATDEGRMKAISAILKGYDIIAVQEISNVHEIADPGCPRNDNSCPGHPNCNLIRNTFERYLNQEHGLNYKFVFSPQVKDERYLYIYNPDKVSMEEHGLVDDPEDSLPICALKPENTGKMVRQPFKAKFQAGKFDFVLLTVHTRPSINLEELEGLEYFYTETEKQGEPDVIVLGDLNADCDSLKADGYYRSQGVRIHLGCER